MVDVSCEMHWKIRNHQETAGSSRKVVMRWRLNLMMVKSPEEVHGIGYGKVAVVFHGFLALLIQVHGKKCLNCSCEMTLVDLWAAHSVIVDRS